MRQASIADIINLVSIAISIMVLVVIFVWFVSGVYKGRAKVHKQKSILVKAAKAAATEYRINIFLMRNGSFIQLVYGTQFDSVFKVAQYCPPRFEEWTTKWQIYEKGAVAREYWRGYYADDGETYAVMVGTSDGLWPQHAEAYLNHL